MVVVRRGLVPTGRHETLTHLLLGRRSFIFSQPVKRVSTDSSYLIYDDTLAYRLYFTPLPLVHLRLEASVNEWVRVPGELHYVDDRQEVRSLVGVRERGNFSLKYPKDSYDLQFTVGDDPYGTTRDVQFPSMREDDDWVLDGLYNEPLRVNAYIGHQLWLRMHDLYYQRQEPEALPGARVSFVETFVDGRYYGLQMLSEQVDRKQLELKKSKEGRLRGIVTKGVVSTANVAFLGSPPPLAEGGEYWDGFQLNYPDESLQKEAWRAFADFRAFFTESTDAEFLRDVEDYIDLDNAIDYLLLANVMGAADNFGKNVHYARYDAGRPWIVAPWDLDTTFGNNYDSSDRPATDEWHSNGLFDRLTQLSPAGFNTHMCKRYRTLRRNIFSPDYLIDRFHKALALLDTNRMLEREELRWSGPLLRPGPAQRRYTERWIRDRIDWLDTYLCELATGTYEPAPSAFRLYPNPAHRQVTLAGLTPKVDVMVYDLLGRIALRVWARSRVQTIDVSNLLPGMYTVRAGRAVQQLIIR